MEKYASYIPTKQDHAGLEKYITKQTEKTSTDSIQSGNDEPILLYDDYIYPDNDSLKLEAPELTPAFQPVPLLPIYSAQPDSVKQQTAEKKKEKQEKKQKPRLHNPKLSPTTSVTSGNAQPKTPSAGMNF